MRRNDKPGADPFLQASNVVPDIMENGYSHDAEDDRAPADTSRRGHVWTDAQGSVD